MTENSDFFALFSLPRQFDIDMAQLESRYIELQRQLHPDKFASKSGQEKLSAQGRAVDVNTAYQTLKNPLQRAGYLLRLSGVEFDLQKEQTIFDQDLLMEMMQRREELADITNAVDLQKLVKTLSAEIEANYKILSGELQKNNFDAVKSMILRQQYLQKMLVEIRQKQSNLLEGAA